ncbi:MAG: hypothetical protein AAB693_01250, partial [Patescibacteria group bacterium]
MFVEEKLIQPSPPPGGSEAFLKEVARAQPVIMPLLISFPVLGFIFAMFPPYGGLPVSLLSKLIQPTLLHALPEKFHAL